MDCINMLEHLKDIIKNAPKLPLSDKVIVKEDEVLNILENIEESLPNIIEESKWIIDEKRTIIIDAQKEAENIIKEAELRLNKLIDEKEVVKEANERSEIIIDNAKKDAREIRIGANKYAEEELKKLNIVLQNATTVVEKGIRKLQGFNE